MSREHYKKKLNLDRNFVSEIDEFLADFDKQYPKKSVSQEKEIEQYQVLYDETR